MIKRIFTGIIALITYQMAFAQVSDLEFIREQHLRAGMHFKTWGFEKESGLDRFTEFAFPVTYSLPVNRRLSIDFVTSPFFSTLSPIAGNSESFNSLSDSYIRTSYILGDNLAIINFGASLPSGKTKLDAEELEIAGIAANRPLDNPVSNLGTGVNLNFGLAIAQKLGPWVLGIGAGYAYRGEFDVIDIEADTTASIEPGDEFNLTLGIDRDFELQNGKAKLIADLVYTTYRKDDLANLSRSPVFEAGDKIVAQARFLFPLAAFKPVMLTLRNRWRLNNKSNNAALIDNGNELELGVNLFHPVTERLQFKYLLDSKFYSNTVNDSEGAVVFGIGLGVDYGFSQHVAIDPSIKFSKGKINTGPGTDVGIAGLEFSIGLAFTF